MDEKAQNLLGAGWTKYARASGGHYTYVSPLGDSFSRFVVKRGAREGGEEGGGGGEREEVRVSEIERERDRKKEGETER